MDNNIDRGRWPLGIVTELKHDPDGEVREVTLRTARRETLHRSINMLIPLELDDDDSSSLITDNEATAHDDAP